MRAKTLWFFLCVILIATLPAIGANHTQITPRSMDQIAVPMGFGNVADEVDSVIFSEDFESGAPGWTFQDLTVQNTWHVDDYNHYSGGGSTLSWWSGDTTIMGYSNVTLTYLVSPTLNLSGAVSPTLSFKLFHSVEVNSGATPPYDGWDACNVWISTNNGQTWSVLPNPTPAYNVTSSYAFGSVFNMGPGIAGWGGYSGGGTPGAWVDASFSLSNFISNQVKIRFALCSDSVTATPNDPTLRGMFVDNVLIRDGSTTYLENNAEGIAIPSDLIPTPGMTPVGNLWHIESITNPPPPSPPHVAKMSDSLGSYPPLVDCVITSPVINLTTLIPGSGLTYLNFSYAGGMNTGDPTPSDVWTVQFFDADTGTTWITLPGSSYTTLPSTFESFSGQGLDISSKMGRNIRVRIRFTADNDAYTGSGMLMDNFAINYTPGLPHDVGARKLKIPMPTSTYFATIPGSVEIHNQGLLQENLVPSYYRVNYGIFTPIIPWNLPIPPDSFRVRTFTWTVPDTIGNYFFQAWTQLGTDLERNNDTTTSGMVDLTGDSLFELGYDNRQYDYSPGFTFQFDPGEGAYIRYTPVADRVTFDVYGHYLKARFNDTGSIRIHIYQAGTDTTQPGLEVDQWDAMVADIAPNWQLFDIRNVAYLQSMHDDFWVQYERIDATSAHLTGDSLYHSGGHFYANFGTGIAASDYDFFARAIFGIEPLAVEANGVEALLPKEFALHQNAPNPFNPATIIRYDLPAASHVTLAVYDLAGRLVTTLVEGRRLAGRHQVAFDGTDLASGVYLYKITAGEFNAAGKMVLLK